MQSPFTGRVALHQQHQRRFCSKVHLAHECLSPWETFERKVKNKKICKSHLACICIMHTPFKMTKNTGRSPFTDKAIMWWKSGPSMLVLGTQHPISNFFLAQFAQYQLATILHQLFQNGMKTRQWWQVSSSVQCCAVHFQGI